MRLVLGGPSKWKKLSDRNPTRKREARQWLSDQLNVAVMESQEMGKDLVVGTSLNLGLDTLLAGLCYEKGIKFNVFLSCPDQDKFWDEGRRETFAYLKDQGHKVTLVDDKPYQPGCIGRQTDAITDWVVGEEEAILLLIKGDSPTQTQKARLREIKSKCSRWKINTFIWRTGGTSCVSDCDESTKRKSSLA